MVWVFMRTVLELVLLENMQHLVNNEGIGLNGTVLLPCSRIPSLDKVATS